MRQECDSNMDGVFFERDGLQVHFDTTALKLPGVRNPLMVARERLQQHLGRLAASCSWFQSLLSSFISRLVDGVAHLVSDEVAAHRGILQGVVF